MSVRELWRGNADANRLGRFVFGFAGFCYAYAVLFTLGVPMEWPYALLYFAGSSIGPGLSLLFYAAFVYSIRSTERAPPTGRPVIDIWLGKTDEHRFVMALFAMVGGCFAFGVLLELGYPVEWPYISLYTLGGGVCAGIFAFLYAWIEYIVIQRV